MPDPLPGPSQHGERWFPLLLLLLALYDLRVELLLLRDHITLTGLSYAVRHHLLAIVIIVAMPSLLRRYGTRRRS